MQTVLALMTILAAAFAETDLMSPPGPSPPPVNLCYQTLYRCAGPLQENAFIAGRSTDYRLLLEDVDGLCETFQQAVNCYRSNLHNCQVSMAVTLATTLYSAAADYLCSDEGKSLLAQYKESQCYNDQTIISQLEGIVGNCQRELNGVPIPEQGRCQAIRDIYACAGNTVTWRCGEAAGRLFIGVTNRVIPIMASDCNERSVDDLVKRSLGFLRRK